jgi:hypothetical protein
VGIKPTFAVIGCQADEKFEEREAGEMLHGVRAYERQIYIALLPRIVSLRFVVFFCGNRQHETLSVRVS